jgi:uncharacterized protein YjiS (DUF1127 family)
MQRSLFIERLISVINTWHDMMDQINEMNRKQQQGIITGESV